VIKSIITPRPSYMDVDTDSSGPWQQGRWSRSVPPAPVRRAAPSVPSAPSGEITRHYDEGMAPGDNELGLRIGGKIRHAQFGVGEVRSWQVSGADLKVTVRFPSAGMKTVLARFLKKV
jgi:hypothetical protein